MFWAVCVCLVELKFVVYLHPLSLLVLAATVLGLSQAGKQTWSSAVPREVSRVRASPGGVGYPAWLWALKPDVWA